MLESMTDAFQVLDADWRITYMNPVARSFFASHGMDPESMIGKHFWDDLFPEGRDSDSARHMFRAMTERVPVAFENYYEPWDSWQFSRFDPLPDGGLANYYQDITAEAGRGGAARQ
jgi:PAS domain-containing protein